MMQILFRKNNGWMAEGADWVYAERTQAKVWAHIEEDPVDMLQYLDNASWNRI